MLAGDSSGRGTDHRGGVRTASLVPGRFRPTGGRSLGPDAHAHGTAADPSPRRPVGGGAGCAPQGAPRALCARQGSRVRNRGHGPADRLRPDYLAAVHRRVHDGAARATAASQGAGDRHRLGLPDCGLGEPVRFGAQHRDRSRTGCQSRQRPGRPRVHARHGRAGRWLPRLGGTRAVRPHHRHGGAARNPASAGRSAGAGRPLGSAGRPGARHPGIDLGDEGCCGQAAPPAAAGRSVRADGSRR